MKLIVVICLVTVVTAARVPRNLGNSQDNVQLVKFNNDGFADGKYSFSFEQSDGQEREEYGEVKNAGLENESLVVRGHFRWVAPDGQTYTVTYVADENGYQPSSAGNAPTGAVPAAIAKLLDL